MVTKRGTGFPRISLKSATIVMEKARKFGKEWTKEMFATYGANKGAASAKSGGFFQRLSALKNFGLIIVENDKIISTELADMIVKPISEKERQESLQKAFLNSNVYKQLFDALEKEVELPEEDIVKFAISGLGVNRDSKDKFLRGFIDSGEFAGLLDYDSEQHIIILKKVESEELHDDEVDYKKITTEARSISHENKGIIDAASQTNFVEMPIGKHGIKVLFPTTYMPDIISGKFQTGVAELIKNEKEAEAFAKSEKSGDTANE